MKNMSTKEMKRSWLVQRLQAPRIKHGILGGGDNPFAFGGGLRNGGLSDEAMGMLREIFAFDYMGAAEFEFGAVPMALQRIAEDHKGYQAHEFEIPLKKIKQGYYEEKPGEREGPDPKVYVICHKDHRDEVQKRILDWATSREDLKEITRLASALVPQDDYDRENQGWLELDNGFFFFTDKTMFEKTAELFGVKV